MNLTGNKIRIELLEEKDVAPLLEYKVRNRSFFQKFQPLKSDNELTLNNQFDFIMNAKAQALKDLGYSFGIFPIEQDHLAGLISLSNVNRGPFQNAYLGYSIDQSQNGKGIATEAVRLLKTIAFSEIKLHRIQAAVMPRNIGSVKVLEKNTFDKIGLSPKYLEINGVWEDHILYSCINQ